MRQLPVRKIQCKSKNIHHVGGESDIMGLVVLGIDQGILKAYFARVRGGGGGGGGSH